MTLLPAWPILLISVIVSIDPTGAAGLSTARRVVPLLEMKIIIALVVVLPCITWTTEVLPRVLPLITINVVGGVVAAATAEALPMIGTPMGLPGSPGLTEPAGGVNTARGMRQKRTLQQCLGMVFMSCY